MLPATSIAVSRNYTVTEPTRARLSQHGPRSGGVDPTRFCTL